MEQGNAANIGDPILIGVVVAIVTAIVTAFVTLLGQYCIQPKIAEKVQTKVEGWNQRRDIFFRATELVIQTFLSKQMTSETGQPTTHSKLRLPPSAEEINRVYYELVFVAKNKETIQMFLNLIPEVSKKERITLGDLTNFIHAAQEELGFTGVHLDNDQVFLLQPKDQPNVTIGYK